MSCGGAKAFNKILKIITESYTEYNHLHQSFTAIPSVSPFIRILICACAGFMHMCGCVVKCVSDLCSDDC